MMMARNWVECGVDLDETGTTQVLDQYGPQGSRVLHVGDGVLGHARDLLSGESVEDGLRDYAAGYDPGTPEETPRPVTVCVGWVLFSNGREAAHGDWEFTVR